MTNSKVTNVQISNKDNQSWFVVQVAFEPMARLVKLAMARFHVNSLFLYCI